ncbi:MAG: serine kinase [Pseudomonadota bacterium]
MGLPVHATAVAYGAAGVLITGAPGAGKSALALHLLALGAMLVADDRVVLTRQDDAVVASAPPGLEGRIEARGIGVVRTGWQPRAVVHLVADLDTSPGGRLPDPQTRTLLGCALPLIAIGGLAHAAPAVRAILTGGLERPD